MQDLQARAVWASRAETLRLFGIPHRQLDHLVRQAAIHAVKLGHKRQSVRLFRVEDVDRALTCMSEGREPRKCAERR